MAKRKRTKGQQRSTKHTHQTKVRVTRTSLKLGLIELRCPGRVRSSCSTSDTRRVNLVTTLDMIKELKTLCNCDIFTGWRYTIRLMLGIFRPPSVVINNGRQYNQPQQQEPLLCQTLKQ